MSYDLLRFQQTRFEMIWGGTRLCTGSPAEEKKIGEAWLIADHAACCSVVADGPHAGRTLRDLLLEDSPALLGTRPTPTVHGQFPLLLKLLDAAQPLSVQVHPDDEAATRLGEPDVGKTEMWHVLESTPGAELICGLDPTVTPEIFAQAVQDGGIERFMRRIPSPAETSVFVPAGTVHAIGAGIFLAEIQQNSNITYRIYDWGRVDTQGRARELHVDKALQVLQFGEESPGAAQPLALAEEGATRHILAACRYFAAERVQLHGPRYTRLINGATFHILLGLEGHMTVRSNDAPMALPLRTALLVPGATEACTIEGQGVFLDYYVPDLESDLRVPLRAAGHAEDTIQCLIHP